MILAHYNYWVVVLLMMIGLYTVMAHGNLVKKLLGLLKSDINRGRSTAGPAAENDVAEIVLWKSEQKNASKKKKKRK